jgi:hypothetical protein
VIPHAFSAACTWGSPNGPPWRGPPEKPPDGAPDGAPLGTAEALPVGIADDKPAARRHERIFLCWAALIEKPPGPPEVKVPGVPVADDEEPHPARTAADVMASNRSVAQRRAWRIGMRRSLRESGVSGR